MGHKRTSDLHADALDLDNFGAAIIANTDRGGSNDLPSIVGVTFGDTDMSGMTTENYNVGLTDGVGLHRIMSVTDQTPNGTYIAVTWGLNNSSLTGTHFYGVTFAQSLAAPFPILTNPYIVNNSTPELIKVSCQLHMIIDGGVAKFKMVFSGFSDISAGGVGSAGMDGAIFTLSSTPLNVYAAALSEASGAGSSAGSAAFTAVDLT